MLREWCVSGVNCNVTLSANSKSSQSLRGLLKIEDWFCSSDQPENLFRSDKRD